MTLYFCEFTSFSLEKRSVKMKNVTKYIIAGFITYFGHLVLESKLPTCHFLCTFIFIKIMEQFFLRRFRLYMLSFMFRFMFANICFEKNQNSKINVMFVINITWNEAWYNQVLTFASLVCYDSCNQWILIMDPNSNINYRRKIGPMFSNSLSY